MIKVEEVANIKEVKVERYEMRSESEVDVKLSENQNQQYIVILRG